MKILSRLSFFIVLSLLMISSSAIAATTTTTTPATPEKKVTEVTPVVLATVNISDAKIVSQVGNIFKISFSLTNREGLQTGVKYSVKLIKDGQYMTDEKVYDESLTLNPNSEVKKEIEYTAPSTLSGDYSLLLVSNNTKGFPFAIISLGDVVLKSSTTGLQILSETCYIQVISEKNNPKYYLLQGVDIKPEESLKLTCSVLNSAKVGVSAVPTYETRYRSTYGDIVPQTGGDGASINFKAGEKKEVSFILPKATSPQSYNVDLTLVSDGVKSNSISTHYVLRGASASIQNVSLDKDYYKGGDEAKVSFIYTPSADSFERSRFGKTELASVSSTLVMTNGKGKSCAKTQTIDLTNPASIKIDVPVKITSSCYDPKITVTVTDDKGTVLGQSEFNVKTTSVPEPKSNVLYFVIALILVVLIILYMILKKKNILPGSTTGEGTQPIASVPMSVLFVFVLLSAFGVISVKNASADTVSAGNAYVVLNIDKGSNGIYTPNERLIATGSVQSPSCGNYPPAGTISASVNGTTKTIYALAEDGTPLPSNGQFSAPSSDGSYSASFSFNVKSGTQDIVTAPTYQPCSFYAPSYCTLPDSNYWYHSISPDLWRVWQSTDTGTKYVQLSSGGTTTVGTYSSGSYSIPYRVISPAAPTVDVWSSQTTLKETEFTTVYWTSNNATSCSCSYKGGSCNPSSGSTAGTRIQGKTVQGSDIGLGNTTFSVTCSN